MPDTDLPNFLSYVFVGHPRCGSSALAAGLREAGLDIRHERPGKDGLVSWWFVGFHDAALDPRGFRPAKPGAKPVISGRTIHYLRRPSDALSSIEVENEFNDRDNNSFHYRRRTILKQFDFDIGRLDRAGAAAASYVLWNRLARRIADNDRPLLVEEPDFGLVSPRLDIKSLPIRNTTVQKFGVRKQMRDFEDSLRAVPREFSDELAVAEALYDRSARR